jgi:hypothetical protein
VEFEEFQMGGVDLVSPVVGLCGLGPVDGILVVAVVMADHRLVARVARVATQVATRIATHVATHGVAGIAPNIATHVSHPAAMRECRSAGEQDQSGSRSVDCDFHDTISLAF